MGRITSMVIVGMIGLVSIPSYSASNSDWNSFRQMFRATPRQQQVIDSVTTAQAAVSPTFKVFIHEEGEGRNAPKYTELSAVSEGRGDAQLSDSQLILLKADTEYTSDLNGGKLIGSKFPHLVIIPDNGVAAESLGWYLTVTNKEGEKFCPFAGNETLDCAGFSFQFPKTGADKAIFLVGSVGATGKVRITATSTDKSNKATKPESKSFSVTLPQLIFGDDAALSKALVGDLSGGCDSAPPLTLKNLAAQVAGSPLGEKTLKNIQPIFTPSAPITVVLELYKGEEFKSVTFDAVGGKAPYTYELSGLALKDLSAWGLGMEGNILKGAITNNPNNAMSGAFKVRVKDACGKTKDVTFDVTVFPEGNAYIAENIPLNTLKDVAVTMNAFHANNATVSVRLFNSSEMELWKSEPFVPSETAAFKGPCDTGSMSLYNKTGKLGYILPDLPLVAIGFVNIVVTGSASAYGEPLSLGVGKVVIEAGDFINEVVNQCVKIEMNGPSKTISFPVDDSKWKKKL